MTDEAPEEQCVVHMTDFDPDCEMCKAELATIERTHNTNAAANQLLEQRLAARGTPVPAVNVIALRLNTLIESACGGNPKTRARFELSFMANYAAALQQADRNAPTRLIVPGPPGVPGMPR